MSSSADLKMNEKGQYEEHYTNEVFGLNFSADLDPYQRSNDCVIAAGQITERPHDVKAVRYTQPTLRCKRKVRSQTDFTPPPDWNPYGMCV